MALFSSPQLVVVWNTRRVTKGKEVVVLAKAHTDVDVHTMKIAFFDDTRCHPHISALCPLRPSGHRHGRAWAVPRASARLSAFHALEGIWMCGLGMRVMCIS